ncbi:MAG: molybdenum cofactor biosynthesis protein MoaE [Gammaproteobacteria bacterium]|nr:molybdenum cofactor biosynthesis protein MoaE [Gammaproteobacteria bacterium]
MATEIRIQTADFSLATEWDGLRARSVGSVGAVASFVGLVRDRDADSQVTGLYLEHYPGMTEDSIAAILTEAQARWALQDIVVVHRVGLLKPGDQIVFVQVAAGHRGDAFAACQFVMDFLKTDAVLWKREDRGDTQSWLEASGNDRSQVDHWRADDP